MQAWRMAHLYGCGSERKLQGIMSSLLQAALEAAGAGNSVGSGSGCEDVAVMGGQK